MRHPLVTFDGVHCSIILRRPTERVVILEIQGRDTGELGDAPFKELAKDLEVGRLDLFIDARKTLGAGLDVSGQWAQWLRTNKGRFRRVSMLTGSRFVQLTAEFVRRFAEMGDTMNVYTDAASFETALSLTLASEP